MNTLHQFINDPRLVDQALEKTRSEYRPLDPGWYLYRLVLREKDIFAKFNREFIELVYVTLAAWNMNSRGARLAEWSCFERSIHRFEDQILGLAELRLESVSQPQFYQALNGPVREMFSGMELVAPGKPRLVTYSKTFHFFSPNLFVPIDRSYTLMYFYGHSNVPSEVERQFEKISELHREFRRFANCVPLADRVDAVWNGNVPKIIDNMIIGYQRMQPGGPDDED